VQDSKTELSAGIVGGKKAIEIATTPRGIDDIAREAFGDAEAIFTGVELFEETKTIVSFVTNTTKNTVFEEGYGVVVFKYNEAEQRWINITEGFIYNQSNYDIGESATNYLRSFGDE
jgi:hypothetical protein